MSGVELAYQQNFDFLPAPFDGFGFLGNYTYLESHGSQRLQGASRNNYTAPLYYEKGWFGTRLTYTYRDDFYNGIDGNSQDERIEQAFGTLDGTLTVNFNDSFSAVVEASNILDETSRIRFMPLDVAHFSTDFGRRVCWECGRASESSRRIVARGKAQHSKRNALTRPRRSGQCSIFGVLRLALTCWR